MTKIIFISSKPRFSLGDEITSNGSILLVPLPTMSNIFFHLSMLLGYEK